MNLTDIDTSSLTDDGDALELSDRFRLVLKIEPDDISQSILDLNGNRVGSWKWEGAPR